MAIGLWKRKRMISATSRRCLMTYYRVAFQVEQSPTWTWKSTVLTSLEVVFGFLRLYPAIPPDRLRVFSSPSREALDEQLVRENNRVASQSVTAVQFLQERKIHPGARTGETSEPEAHKRQGLAPIALSTCQSLTESSTIARSLDERGMSVLERRRVELEHGPGGDHDSPYTFTLPVPLPQILAWTRLLGKVQREELEP